MGRKERSEFRKRKQHDARFKAAFAAVNPNCAAEEFTL